MGFIKGDEVLELKASAFADAHKISKQMAALLVKAGYDTDDGALMLKKELANLAPAPKGKLTGDAKEKKVAKLQADIDRVNKQIKEALQGGRFAGSIGLKRKLAELHNELGAILGT